MEDTSSQQTGPADSVDSTVRKHLLVYQTSNHTFCLFIFRWTQHHNKKNTKIRREHGPQPLPQPQNAKRWKNQKQVRRQFTILIIEFIFSFRIWGSCESWSGDTFSWNKKSQDCGCLPATTFCGGDCSLPKSVEQTFGGN